MSLSHLGPGERGRVTQVTGAGAIRQRLLDMGIIPDVELEVERRGPTGDPIWIKLQGFQLSLRKVKQNLF
jgi:Fe2+ transport system protein FeoA